MEVNRYVGHTDGRESADPVLSIRFSSVEFEALQMLTEQDIPGYADRVLSRWLIRADRK